MNNMNCYILQPYLFRKRNGTS